MFKTTTGYLSVYCKRYFARQMSHSTATKSQLITSNNNFNDDDVTLFENAQLINPRDYLQKISRIEQSNLPVCKIGKALYNHIYQIDHHICEPGDEDSFFVCNVDEVKRLYLRWNMLLPRVKPFYAIKCNNDPVVLKTLIELGAGFDCASKNEIEMVLQNGVSPERIVYANPCKSNSFIRYAQQHEVNLTTFDNSDELIKMKKFHPTSKLLLRIITDDETAQCRLSTKFGATMGSAVELLQLAKDLELDVAGVAFHVGSGCSDPQSLIKAISDARKIFDIGKSLGFKMDVLDIGGGFVMETFDQAAEVVTESLDVEFPTSHFPHLKVIAEPGRYFSSSAFTLACHVIAKRSFIDPDTGKESHMIYLNDGVYGNLNCIIFDHQVPIAKTLTHNNQFHYNNTDGYDTEVSIWGPTCDGLDCISQSAILKYIPQVGDWIYFENIGAYTSLASTSFNGFTQRSQVMYV